MSTASIPRSDVQKLWRLASSRCSYYECPAEIVKEEKENILGAMAHIVAEAENGPRGHSELTPAERNSYSNLILLCPNHHSLIDTNVEEWTIEKLHKMKQEHEEWVKTQLSKGEASKVHVCPGHLHYINFRRLVLDPTAYRYLNSWDSTFNFSSIKNLSELGLMELAQIRMLVEHYLKTWQPSVLTLNDVNEENAGARIKFETQFRTKNVPSPNELASFRLTGNIKRDPHIYCKKRERKVYFTIDPRWITTDTAFYLFKSGIINLSGLGIISAIIAADVYITPIIIGSPDYPGSEYF